MSGVRTGPGDATATTDVTGLAAIVDHYLQLCEDRDLEAAGRLLAPGAVMVFPGGAAFTSLEAMVATPKPYAWVRKHRDRYVSASDGDRPTVVSIGRLYGERHDGTAFDDVRYVDVFTLAGGRIVEQLVWNDLAAAGIAPAPRPAS